MKMLFSIILAYTLLSSPAQGKDISIDLSKPNSMVLPLKDLPEHCAGTHFFQSPEVISDLRVWKYYTQLKMPLVRFPGGLANWYDWKTGKIETQGRAVFKFMEGERFDGVAFNEMEKVAASNGLSIIYVLNLNDTPEKIAELANEWEKKGTPIRAVEMGNELYTKKFADEIGGVSSYLGKARKALVALRRGGYSGPVGVELAPELMPGEEGHVHQPHWKKWNQAMASDGLAEFDAVIMHYYPTSKNKADFAEAEKNGIDGFARNMRWVRSQYPGKKIWITEWNIGMQSNEKFNSLKHALFVMNMLQVMNETRVDIACYHVLTGFGFELLGPNRLTRAGASNAQTAKLLRRAPYFAFLLYKKAAEGILRHSGQVDNIQYMVFENKNEVNVLFWSDKPFSDTITIRAGNAELKYREGYSLNGPLDANNGSTLGYLNKKNITANTETLSMQPIDSPKINTPGITFLGYERLISPSRKQ